MEVLRGARNKREMDIMGRQLARFQTFHILKQDSEWAVQQFRTFWLSHQIGINDCLIGAITARTQLPLYTLNLKDFAPLPGVNAITPY
jgi:predicted nucleic acid-binding protein